MTSGSEATNSTRRPGLTRIERSDASGVLGFVPSVPFSGRNVAGNWR